MHFCSELFFAKMFSVAPCPNQKLTADWSHMTDENRKVSLTKDGVPIKHAFWGVRESLPTIEAMHKYDAYLRNHRRRLAQLEREANGIFAPSESSWYSGE
jgi:hypothetical protein